MADAVMDAVEPRFQIGEDEILTMLLHLKDLRQGTIAS